MKKSNFKIKFSKQARQDLKHISKSPYAEKFVKLLHLIEKNSFAETKSIPAELTFNIGWFMKWMWKIV